MKYLLYILIALCLGLVLGLTRDLATEITDLRERDDSHKQEIAQLRADLALSNHNAQRVIDEVREILEGKNFIPVYDWRTFLVYDTVELINEKK